jgi:hypothetical protein
MADRISTTLLKKGCEDDERCWSSRATFTTDHQLRDDDPSTNPIVAKLWDKPLLRLWDGDSGSRPTALAFMLPRVIHTPLATAEDRQKTLALHLDHRKRIAKPYISFFSTPERLRGLAKQKEERSTRRVQQLTLIDPQARIRNGLPILDYEEEARHYNIKAHDL